MKTPTRTRKIIVQEARRLALLNFPEMFEPGAKGACFTWATCIIATMTALKTHRPLIQAGTCYWPRLRPEQDDGADSTLTHFGYKWDYHSPMNEVMLDKGDLPEMHVWVGLLFENELVDLSTGALPEQCQKTIGQDWPGDQPPDYLWCKTNELPAGVTYQPDLNACLLAKSLVDYNLSTIKRG